MDDYAEYGGRLLADRYRLPAGLLGDPELTGTVAYDTAGRQEVLLRQVPLPEVVDEYGETPGTVGGGATRQPADRVVRRAVDAAQAVARLPDHPRLEQVFDVFVEGENLWVVGELLPARPLAAYLADAPISPHRAAEIAADLLAALRAVHANGWVHRNITARTVLVCDDGRAVLTGLAPGAAQETLCGYDVLPPDGPAPDGAGEPGRHPGPTSALAAERARQERMTTVGAVTERWAPEQAAPAPPDGSQAPPVGPAADLWALGVLLFRAVEGRAPYPEEDAAELLRAVCAEAPMPAADCGPMRPVVESLMRQDAAERTDFTELRGRLRSLVRSAPEPEVGRRTVPGAPSLEAGGAADPRRLPILRRRGELVRRRRARPSRREPGRVRPEPQESRERPRAVPVRRERPRAARPTRDGGAGSPRRLGAWLLVAVLAGLGAALVYAMAFMPADTAADAGDRRRSEAGVPSGTPGPGGGAPGGEPQATASAERVPDGYKLGRDPAGFAIAVPEEWDRRSTTDSGQVRYNGGQVEMVIVNGRDSTEKYGRDPMAYQSDDEPELKAYRASDWASTSGLRRIDVGDSAMAEGTFSWQDDGRDVYARNRAMILDGRYHVLLVMGSEAKRQEIDRHFEAVADTYRVTAD